MVPLLHASRDPSFELTARRPSVLARSPGLQRPPTDSHALQDAVKLWRHSQIRANLGYIALHSMTGHACSCYLTSIIARPRVLMDSIPEDERKRRRY